MKVKIEVKRKHIKTGLKGSPYACAVVYAIADRVKSNFQVVVTNEVFLTTKNEGDAYRQDAYRRELPLKVQRFIQNFDTRPKDKIKPMSFYLNIPTEHLRES